MPRKRRAPDSAPHKGHSKLTTEAYNLLMEAYRSGVRGASGLARVAHINRKTAARALSDGWPDLGWLPLPDALAAEMEAARAEVQRRSVEELRRQMEIRDQARDESLSTLAAEARILNLARSDVGSVLALAAEMLPAIKLLSDRMRTTLIKQLHDENAEYPVKAGLEIVNRFAGIVRTGMDAANLVVQTERMRRGDPVKALEDQPIPETTEEEAIANLEQLIDTVKRKEEVGLVVLEGGKGKPEGSNGAAGSTAN